jgi:hypothetical protein
MPTCGRRRAGTREQWQIGSHSPVSGFHSLSSLAGMRVLCGQEGFPHIGAVFSHIAWTMRTHPLAKARTAMLWLLPSPRLRR